MSKLVKLTTTKGNILLALDDAKAPVTVANFLNYVQQGFYNGLLFHRVIRNFMIQGGGMEPSMKLKPPEAPIVNESANGLSNCKYTVAMARTREPDSATAQFFINLAHNKFLDKGQAQDGFGYAVFGEVVEGQDVVDEIARVATHRRGFHDDVPVEDVLIEKAEIVDQQTITSKDVGSVSDLLGLGKPE